MPSAAASLEASGPQSQADLTIALPDGRRMGYAEYGDPSGVPVIGLHGTPGSRFMFRIADPVAARLGIRLLAPERPGFGISTRQRGRSLQTHASDIAAFADALGIPRFAVTGVSGGGPYAVACAALLPERVTALGLISPVGPIAGPEKPVSIGFGHNIAFRIAPRTPPLIAGVFVLARLAFLHTPNLMFGFIRGRAAPCDRPILSRQEVRSNLIAGIAEGCRPGIRAALQEMGIFARPWNLPFDQICAPAFLWQGLSDRNVPVASALALGRLIPNCHTFPIDHAGHYWIFDNVQRVLETLVDAAGKPIGHDAGS